MAIFHPINAYRALCCCTDPNRWRNPVGSVHLLRKAPEICYLTGRGNANFQHVFTFFSKALVSLCADWRAMAHFPDDVLLDHDPPGRVAPDLTGKAIDLLHPCRRPFDLVNLLPLPDDAVGVGTVDGLIAAAMPNRDGRPAALEF